MQIKVDLKVFLFFCIFLITKNIKIYSILMIFSLIHELGHLMCGLFLGFKPEKMTILPYGLKISFKIKPKDFNKRIYKANILSIKKIVLALSGPITNIICIIITYILNNKIYIDKSLYENIMYANILIAMFNMLPIYPLDGGRVVRELMHIFLGLRESYKGTLIISEVCLYILTAISSILILYYKNIAIFIIIVYLWYIVYKNKKEIKLKEKVYKSIDNYNKLCNK